MKIIVTGFDPFGNERINPSIEAVKRLPDRVNGVEVLKVELATVFGESAQQLRAAIDYHQPDAVLCVGQAGGRAEMTPERVAINVDDARIPDNKGNQPIDCVIQPDGESAYFSTLPIKAMVQAMREADIPATVSNSAGTFVCNHIMYQLLYYVHNRYPHIKGGFIHIPYMEEQVSEKPHTPFLTLDQMVTGLEKSIEAIFSYEQDILLSDGKLD